MCMSSKIGFDWGVYSVWLRQINQGNPTSRWFVEWRADSLMEQRNFVWTQGLMPAVYVQSKYTRIFAVLFKPGQITLNVFLFVDMAAYHRCSENVRHQGVWTVHNTWVQTWKVTPFDCLNLDFLDAVYVQFYTSSSQGIYTFSLLIGTHNLQFWPVYMS